MCGKSSFREFLLEFQKVYNKLELEDMTYGKKI